MLQFMTGPRRIASGLLTIAKSDYGSPKIMPFLSPYACGDDNLIVKDTPAADVHVDDAEPAHFSTRWTDQRSASDGSRNCWPCSRA
ncbi:unnamed protein product [Ectocarpus sp. 8 AP-2014]